ncbi:SRPBCC family protein [Chelativorans sp. YIM 93263]|uniref:SRPBCC family protein n=1 Tax=Chelativorans sp. YIM 93263 TaxID=2906648 RepID=UPI002379F633|nr:SRPBCC family protein [Chelativorans sp. YIM 93263]
MTDKGLLIEEKAVRFERLLPGPVERVWEHLTRSEYLPLWFGGSGMTYEIEGREGGAVNLGNGHIRGIVTRWRPPHLLSYTWNLADGPGLDSAYPESFLTFELKPQGDEVLLILTHRPIGDPFQPHTLMGWHTFLDLLGALLRGEELEPSDTAMQRNAGIYGVEQPMHPPYPENVAD